MSLGLFSGRLKTKIVGLVMSLGFFSDKMFWTGHFICEILFSCRASAFFSQKCFGSDWVRLKKKNYEPVLKCMALAGL